MNQPAVIPPLDAYELQDRYRRETGRVFMTGTQALVRLPMLQRALDRRRGLNTAGFISGYRGSPLGAYDQELWRAERFLRDYDIEFLPAINEDLAATAILGTQQVETDADREVDGVFSIWYGKGPGVDRSGDALKHGNAYGSSPHGGVLVVAGDDHGCVSSSMSHQSDVAFMAYFMPTLNPASVAEYIEYGLYGFALSRYSGTWVGFKAISETVESAASVTLDYSREFATPTDYEAPEYGLHYRWPDLPGPQVEARLVAKLEAVRAFARANPIDRAIYNIPDARFGIITTGKGHLDLMEALRLLGIDERRARELGIDIYKVGMVWPLETRGARAFLRGKDEVLVVEEKRGIIESELKEALYDYQSDKPSRMVGKYDEEGRPLVPWTGELSPALLAPIVAARITHEYPEVRFDEQLAALRARQVAVSVPTDVKRTPYFCAGCPHSTSTRVPEGSKALAGIGCHFMASWMDRNTESLIQMGGEGVNWVGKSRFTGNGHVFQNLGEGTYFHSGYMAIRQAVAAGTNITYKILFNDAVAMTGGQPVDGVITVPAIACQVRAEGVQRIAVMSDEPEKYRDKSLFPPSASFHHRDELDSVQRELRDTPGVTVLIYDQTCAAEKRRLRKKGAYPDPDRRMFINQAVCEGCGDCSLQSNCLSIYPVDTELGRKRKIDQSSCNKDYSCVKGFCPSFVSVLGGRLRRSQADPVGDELESRVAALPAPPEADLSNNFNLLVAGIGGTGVVTVGALVTMAAHLEGKGASVLDFTGFAQKGGAVISHIRIGSSPAALNQVRIADGCADAVVACDIVVGTDPRTVRVLARDRTRVLINHSEVPTGQFVRNRNADIRMREREAALTAAVGVDNLHTVPANELMERILGNTVYANVFLLGHAWQQGAVPVSLQALEQALSLNGVNVAENLQAFAWGRVAAVDADYVGRVAGLVQVLSLPPSLEEIVEHRAGLLVQYQGESLARDYRDFIAGVKAREQAVKPGSTALAEAVARNLYKLMAYKDEYEVARLYTDDKFRQQLEATFEGDYTLQFHLAPPVFSRGLDEQGRPRKRTFGPWMLQAFAVLARFRGLRGTRLDPFGYHPDRRQERALIADYRALVQEVLAGLASANLDQARELARLPEEVRGYGPVKAESVVRYQEQRAGLLHRFHNPQAVVQIHAAAV
ncbi:indolepyruvate ferredoxin oxidoreductase family protein [Haliea sp. E1-2-M8]|uniref:indolepyruvate ferredoxin oxidoreductase family protein n=1 Tax=Haliea sp. E1-2-M8 TaxID=3064706 RepID=UPI002716EEAF|nr:indolepyruvate ferredoxin oxidoreductase family protein [Haliea sp. E1-2-M8]MDO8863171.1 indolepyruvate ferredoxin oxidoreductase family protein [Haliea sp. E1-2-M8]